MDKLIEKARDKQISSQTRWELNDPRVQKMKEGLINEVKEGKGDERSSCRIYKGMAHDYIILFRNIFCNVYNILECIVID